VFVATAGSPIAFFDVSTPEAPVPIVWGTDVTVSTLAVSDGVMYATDEGSSEIVLYDVTDIGNSLDRIGAIPVQPTPRISAMLPYDGYLYVAHGNDDIYDVSDPKAPVAITTERPTATAYDDAEYAIYHDFLFKGGQMFPFGDHSGPPLRCEEPCIADITDREAPSARSLEQYISGHRPIVASTDALLIVGGGGEDVSIYGEPEAR
jgi:hypothetical protein